ncbi:MAG: tyrosine-type recombinase/integrase, partial [Clostridiales bacterium]|nr:tyrosine-type recombinase/integrase [Clostridiales bacterium]
FLKIRGTKTANAVRTVPIPLKLQGLLPDECKYTLSHTKNGRMLNAGEFNLMWKHFKREMNILMGAKTYRNKLLQDLVADDLIPYCLRHTFCTDLQKAGIDLRTAQYLMGHADIKMTANIYTHVDDEIVKSTYDILSKK